MRAHQEYLGIQSKAVTHPFMDLADVLCDFRTLNIYELLHDMKLIRK
jgi:hypothetical protein